MQEELQCLIELQCFIETLVSFRGYSNLPPTPSSPFGGDSETFLSWSQSLNLGINNLKGG